MNGRRIHRSATVTLSAVMALIGLVLAGEAIAQGAVVSPRMLAAVLFLAAGLGRIYVERRRGAVVSSPEGTSRERRRGERP